MCARQVHAVAKGREDAGVGGHVERADLVEREVLVVEVVDGGEVGRRVATVDTTNQSARKSASGELLHVDEQTRRERNGLGVYSLI
jgi:hypothetical protein